MNSENLVHSDSGLKRYFINIYHNVALGLGLMGAVAFVMHTFNLYPVGGVGLLITFLPLMISLGINMNIRNITSETAQLLYFAFSASLGMSLSHIFAIYTGESIFSAFMSTAVIFAVLAFYARTTDKDLTKIGNILHMSLWGLILVSIINIFIGSSLTSIVLSALSVIIFSGFIMYDHQVLSNLYYSKIDHESREKIAILGALSLLINFVNIFISLLRLFGDRRRD